MTIPTGRQLSQRVAALLLLCLMALGPLQAETPHVEVGTWNLEWFNDKSRGFPENTHGGPTYGPRDAEGLKTIAYLIQKHGIDVLGLEEISRASDLKALLEYLPGFQMYVVPDRASQHCALIWDASQVTARIQPPLAALAITSGCREGLHASLWAGKFSFDYMGVHLANKDDQVAQQTSLLSAWLHGNLAQSRPTDDDVIIGGDFNLTPRESALQTLLRDPWLVWCWAGAQALPPTRACSEKTIDHLFMSCSCYTNQRLGETVVPREDLQFGDRYRELVSDHLPVIQSFRTDCDQ